MSIDPIDRYWLVRQVTLLLLKSDEIAIDLFPRRADVPVDHIQTRHWLYSLAKGFAELRKALEQTNERFDI